MQLFDIIYLYVFINTTYIHFLYRYYSKKHLPQYFEIQSTKKFKKNRKNLNNRLHFAKKYDIMYLRD